MRKKFSNKFNAFQNIYGFFLDWSASYENIPIMKQLAEEFIAGKELTVGILGEMPLPLVRIEVAGELYDYQAKYFSDDTQYFCPSGLPGDEEQAIQAKALQAYQVLGCEGWGRIDLILDSTGTPYFLEANTSPGMTNHSLVPMAANAVGIVFEDLVLEILKLSYVE